MATKILMPKLSDTMTEGVVLKWLKNEGEKVKQGETLVEIESDKADMELEAYDSGILRKIMIPAGGSAGVAAGLKRSRGCNEHRCVCQGRPGPQRDLQDKNRPHYQDPDEM